MSCLSKEYRLNDSKDFNSIYKSGKKWHTTSFVAFFKPSQKLEVAFVSSKKVGKAVQRNLARRRLRAAFQTYENKITPGKYIIVAKESLHKQDYNGLIKDYNFAFKRLELFK